MAIPYLMYDWLCMYSPSRLVLQGLLGVDMAGIWALRGRLGLIEQVERLEALMQMVDAGDFKVSLQASPDITRKGASVGGLLSGM